MSSTTIEPIATAIGSVEIMPAVADNTRSRCFDNPA
jgi:hypothetical protein